MLSLAPLGDEFRVNTSIAGNQQAPSVDVDSAGNYVAVWQSSHLESSANDIFVQRYNAQGSPLGVETRVNASWAGDQTDPHVAVAADGRFVVAWVGPDADGLGIFARRFAADGTPLGGAIQVNSSFAANQSHVDVAMDRSSGDFVVVWHSDADGSAWGVYGQRFAANGTPQGSEFLASTHTADNRTNPSVAMDDDGDFVVTWQSYRADDTWSWGVFGQRFNANGSTAGTAFLVNTETYNQQYDASVATDADGDFVVAWTSNGQDLSGAGVYAQRFAANGAAAGAEFRVNTYTDSDQSQAAVSMDASGNFVVAWTSYNQDGSGDGVYAQQYAANGTAVGGEFRLNTHTDYDQQWSALAMVAQDHFVATWQSQYQDESGWGVYGQLYSAGSAQPDLVPVLVTAPPGANQGQTIDLRASIHNQGGVAAGSFYCQYYLSTDAVITTADTPLGGLFTVSGLGAGRFHTDTRQLQVPLDAPTGDFYLGLLLDTSGAVVEGNEANNGTATGSFAAVDVRAPVATLGGESRVNRTFSGEQTEPAVDVDAAGNYVVVWQGTNQQGWENQDIFYQRFNARGTPLGHEVQVNPDWQGEQTTPDVAVADDGTFVVTWTGSDGDGSGVFFRRFAADGAPLTDAVLVNTYTSGDQGTAEVAMRGDSGDFVVVWQSDSQDGSSWGVYGRRFQANGAPAGSEFLVNTYTANAQQNPAVAVDGDGDFVVTWQSDGQDPENWGWGVYGQRFAAGGAAVGSEFRVNTYTYHYQSEPSVAMDADGDFVVAWSSYGQDGSGWGVYAQRFTAGGAAAGEEFRVNTETNSHQSQAGAGMDASGNFVIVWTDYGQDGSGDGVYAQQYAANGTSVGGEFRVNTYTYNYQQRPAVAMVAQDHFVTTWQSQYQDGSGWGIYGQWYGQGLSQADLVPVLAIGPAGANLGQTIGVTAEVRNQGGTSAGPFTCQYYLSTDSVFTTADVPLGAPFVVAGLSAYETCVDSQTFAVPSVAAGPWYVGIIVDTTNAVTEANEANNLYQSSFDEVSLDIAPMPAFGPERRANTTIDSEQSTPAVGFDSAGNCVAVWQSWGQDGSDYGIYGQRFDAAGSPVGSEFRVNTTTAGRQYLPRIAVAPNGSFVVTWPSDPQDGSGWDVYAQRFAADASRLGGEFRVNTYTNSDQYDPDIAVDGSGNFLITWCSYGQDASSNHGIYAQRYHANGTANGTEFWVCSDSAPEQVQPEVAMNADGRFVVVWDNNDTIYARQFLANGTAAGDEFVVNTFTYSTQRLPDVAVDAGGNFVITWESYNVDGNSWGVSAKRYAADGSPRGEEFRVNTRSESEQSNVAVAADSDGDFVVVWRSYQGDGSGQGLFAQRYRADGSPRGGEFRVNQYINSDQYGPAVAMRDAEHILIAWHSYWQDDSSWGVYTQLLGVSDVNSRPNLIASDVSVPSNAYLGESMDVTLTIQNTGMSVAPPSTAHLWLSDDTSLGGDFDTGVDVAIPQLFFDPSNNYYQTTVSYTWPGFDPIGTDREYYFLVVADSQSAIAESDETDNAGASDAAYLRMPNLQGSVSVPSSVRPGEDLDITVQVYNMGDARAPSSTAHLWLSDDDQIGNGDDIDLLIDVPVPALNTYYWPDYSYAHYETTVPYTWPTLDPFGTDRQYYVVFKVDVADAVVEQDESDNETRSYDFEVLMPDLVVESMNCPAEVNPGEEFTATVTVRNDGTAPAEASTLHLWLSDDAVAGNADDHDLFIDVPVPALEVYGWPNYTQFTTDVVFTWPAVDPFQTDLVYHVVAKADVTDDVSESDEDNNWGVSDPIQLQVVDLVPTGFRTASTVQGGEELTAQLTVENIGLLAAPASTAHVWLSDNDVLGDADDIELAPPLDVSVPSLPGGSWMSYCISVPWPTVDPFGTDGEYFLLLKVDRSNLVAEGNEGNNVIVSRPIAMVTPIDLDIQLAGHLGGTSLAVAVQGDRAFELTDAGLRVLDVGDPAHISKLTELVFVAGDHGFLSLNGSLLYEADDSALRVFDVSVPHQPVMLSETPVEPGTYSTIAFQGSLALAARVNPAQLDIVDLSNPAAPAIRAHYGLRGMPEAVAVQGSTAYVTYYDPAFRHSAIEVVNLSDPSHPAFVSRRGLSAMWEATAISVSGSSLAVGGWGDLSQVRLIDASNPASLRVQGVYETGYGILDVVLSGTTLQVATVGDYDYYQSTVNLTVVDVSHASDPVEVGAVNVSVPSYFYEEGGHSSLLTEAGSQSYISLGTLTVVSVADPANPAVVGDYGEPSAMSTIALAGTVACMGAGNRLELIDVSQPAIPRHLGTYASASSYGVEKVVISGHYAILDTGQLEVVDIANPAAPAQVESEALADLGNPSDMLADGNILYVLVGSLVHVLDISDPANPVERSTISVSSTGTSQLALSGGRLIVSNSRPSDVEPNDTRGTAQHLGSLADPVVAWGLSDKYYDYDYYRFTASAGDHVHIDLRGQSEGAGSLDYGRVTLYDASGNWLHEAYYDGGVVEINDFQLGLTGAYYVCVYSYYSAYTYQLAVALNDPLPPIEAVNGPATIYNVADPAHPVMLSAVNVGAAVQSVAASGAQMYVSLGDPAMLEVWDLSDPAHPVRGGSCQVPSAGSVVISGNLAMIASGSLMQVVDVSDPLRPVRLRSYQAAQTIGGMAAEGLAVYLAANSLYSLAVQPAGVDTPDLAVTQVTAPATVQIGTQFTVGWTARNYGRSAATGTWTDAVYLSTDALLDGSDVLVGQVAHTGPLNSLATYSAQLQATLSSLAPGQYYAIVRSDIDNTVNEWSLESNNTRVSSQPIVFGYPDLTPTHVEVPPVVQRGDALPLDWIVYNADLPPAAGNWTDEVYLSTDMTFNPGVDQLVGTVTHTGGLAGRTVYHGQLSVNTASIAEGVYYVIVKTDSAGAVFEDGREANNVYVWPSAFRLGVPTLTLGVPTSGTFDSSGQSKYFRVEVAAGEHLFVSLDDLNNLGYNELYIKQGSAPTRTNYDVRYSVNLAADQRVEIASTAAGSYYILAYADSAPDAPGAFTLTASVLDFQILGVSPVRGGTAGNVTMTVRGANFPAGCSVVLVGAGGGQIAQAALEQDDGERLYPTFDLTGAAPGLYDVRVVGPGGLVSTEVADIFQIVEGGGPLLAEDLIVPSAIRAGQKGTLYVEISNSGLNDSTVPVVWVTLPPGMNATLEADEEPSVTDQILVDVSLPGFPVAVLPPGSLVRVPVYVRAPATPTTASVGLEVYCVSVGAGDDPVSEDGLGVPRAVGTTKEQWKDGKASYTLTGDVPAYLSGSTSWFAGTLMSQFATGWSFASGALSAVPSASNSNFYVWHDASRAGASMTISPSVPWIQVVDTIPVTSPEHVDPTPGDDNLPFYWTVAEAGNSSTARSFSDSPSISLAYVKSQAAASATRSFTVHFLAETHPASWTPPVDGNPEVVIVGAAGVKWGYQLTVQLEPDKKKKKEVPIVRAVDPNDKVGPAGYGPTRFIAADSLMPYTIYYENDPNQGATAAAQVVRITDTLDTDLDLTTFELGEINLYDDCTVPVPAGLQYYQKVVDLRPRGQELLVRITAGLEAASRTVTWLFESLDPDTLSPPEDAFAGFLPVNDKTLHNGEGHVCYTIRPLSGLASGTQITNQAFNLFDAPPEVPTPITLHTIDAGAPTSAVQPLATQLPDGPFTVSWSGQDDANGSGIASYTIYVQRDRGDWEVWLQDTTATSAEFTEGIGGHVYAFRSVAKDNVGHVENDPGTDEASTTLDFSQLRVVQFESTPSGFVAHFRRELDASVLNLYDVEAGTYGPADFTVVGLATGPVSGSLVYDATAKTVTFVKTGGLLAADVYTITLRSAADGFQDLEGHLLDGDVDGDEGGDYVTTVTVLPTTPVVLSMPDFARGPDQTVNVPATGTGIPITLSNASGVMGLTFTIEYDPTLLTVTDLSLGNSMPADWGVEANVITPGHVSVIVYGATPLGPGSIVLATINATVPEDAPYRSAGIVSLSDVKVNEGAIPAVADTAVQVVAYLGDSGGNGTYGALDAAYIARVVVGRDSGFGAYRMKDPVIVGDISGDGKLSSLDAAYLARKIVGREQPQVPNLPDPLPAVVAAGADPVLRLPTVAAAAPGSAVTRPVSTDGAQGLLAFDLKITFDATLLEVNIADVVAGDLDGGWTVIPNVKDGVITIGAYGVDPLPDNNPLNLLQITYHVRSGMATPATALLHFDAAGCTLNDLAGATLPLTPVDGSITIYALPVADPGGPYGPVAEGGTAVLDGTASHDDNVGGLVVSYLWDLDNDGVFGETGAGARCGDELGAHPTFLASKAAGVDGNGSWPVSLKVVNGYGQESLLAATTVQIANAAPTLTLAGPAQVIEGDTYTLTLSSSDPGPDTIAHWTITWGDGNVETVAGNPASVTHVYANAPQDRTISATATDEDGTHAAGNTVAVHVAGRGPTVTITAPADGYHGVRGQARSFTFAASEPDGPGGPFTYLINWGDGSAAQSVTVAGSAAVSHTFTAAGAYTITATAKNNAGTTGPTSAGLPVDILVVEQQGRNVFIGGTKGTDVLTLNRGLLAGELSVLIGGVTYSGLSVGASGSAQILGQGGGDVVTVNGTPGADTFIVTLTGVKVNGTTIKGTNVAGWVFSGRAGTNTMIGPVQNNTWAISGLGSGKLNNSLSFSGMTNLMGSVLSDQFRFLGAFAGVTGGISGSGGTNTLDYSGYKKPVTVNLATRKATGVGSIANFSIVVGSSGSDSLTAAASGSVLLGGPGNDTLTGGAGCDLLIGGSGVDVLHGLGKDDLLFGGTTTYYDEATKTLNAAALNTIFQSWGRTGVAYETRVSELLAGGGDAMVGPAKFTQDASAIDTLFGDDDRDWFLMNLGDQVRDQRDDEVCSLF